MQVIDLHCDTISKLVEAGSAIKLSKNDLNVDIRKLTAGNFAAQFFALFVDMATTENPLEFCLRMVDRFHLEMAENSESISLATNYADFLHNQKEARISAFLTIEEGGVLKGDLANLRNFYRLGVRLMTLTWNYPNEIGFPNVLADCRDKGLTEFGREAVAEMNRLGMIIDVSHLSDQGFYDVAAASVQPFVASHSNARAVTDHARNLTDEMIRLLAEKGGVTGLAFPRAFLGEAAVSRVEDMVRHVRHIHSVGGIGVIALGTDFDGTKPPMEVADSSEIGKLIDGLKQGGFFESDIEKIFFGNAIRVIKQVLG